MPTFQCRSIATCLLLAACGGRVSSDPSGGGSPTPDTTGAPMNSGSGVGGHGPEAGSGSGTGNGGMGILVGAGTSGSSSTTSGSAGAGPGTTSSGYGGSPGTVGAGGSGSSRDGGGGFDVHPPLATCPPNEKAVLLSFNQHDGRVELESIDPETAVASPYPDPRTSTALAGLASLTAWPVFDVRTHRIYARGVSDVTEMGSQIFTIDGISGRVLSSPFLTPPDPMHAPSWLAMNRAGVLLGLVWNGVAEELRAVDPASGACTPYPNPRMPKTLPGLDWISGATFDPAVNRLYVSGGLMPADQMFTVDMETAEVLASPTRQPASVENFAVNRNGTLVGMDWTGTREELRTLDPATGLQTAFPRHDAPYVVTGLATLTGLPTVDNDSGRLYMAGTLQGGDAPQLFVMDALGQVPSRALPAKRIFDLLVVVCR